MQKVHPARPASGVFLCAEKASENRFAFNVPDVLPRKATRVRICKINIESGFNYDLELTPTAKKYFVGRESSGVTCFRKWNAMLELVPWNL